MLNVCVLFRLNLTRLLRVLYLKLECFARKMIEEGISSFSCFHPDVERELGVFFPVTVGKQKKKLNSNLYVSCWLELIAKSFEPIKKIFMCVQKIM